MDVLDAIQTFQSGEGTRNVIHGTSMLFQHQNYKSADQELHSVSRRHKLTQPLQLLTDEEREQLFVHGTEFTVLEVVICQGRY
jgi:hypothetical protein